MIHCPETETNVKCCGIVMKDGAFKHFGEAYFFRGNVRKNFFSWLNGPEHSETKGCKYDKNQDKPTLFSISIDVLNGAVGSSLMERSIYV